ncbi:MAG: FG-GAP repeat protein, partial [Thermoplasmata archaeon]|nr:FG-GAP repeat protein [Thermoplasmata archaeon]
MRGGICWVATLLLTLSIVAVWPLHGMDVVGGAESRTIQSVHSSPDPVANPYGVHSMEEVRSGVIYPPAINYGAGYRIAKGDFNGDGVKDLAFSAIYVSQGSHHTGAVFLLLGPLPMDGIDLSNATPDLAVYGGIEGGRIGESLLFADLNGDGCDELVIGAPSTPVAGAIYIITGGDPSIYGGRIDLPPVYMGGYFTLSFTEFFGGGVLAIWANKAPEENFLLGWDLSSGDVDGDGIEDLIFSQPYAQRVHVLWGNTSWPAQKYLTIKPSDSEEFFGAAVLALDMDSDGLDDIIVGSPRYSMGTTESGAIYIFYGNSSFKNLSTINTTIADVLIEGSKVGMRLGEDMVGLSIYGNPYPLLAVSSPGEKNSTGEKVGAVYLIRGRERGYFGREQSVESVYFLRIFGDESEAPLKRLASFDIDSDGSDELALLRPAYRVDGEMYGEIAIVYSSSIYRGGPKDKELNEMEVYRIRGVDLYDGCGSDAVFHNGLLFIGSYGADGPNNTRMESGEIEIVPTSTLRIRDVELLGTYLLGNGAATVPSQYLTLIVSLYSTKGTENITSLYVDIRQTSGWSGGVVLNWTPAGGLSIHGPPDLLNASLSGEQKTSPSEIIVRIRISFSFLWPSEGYIIFDMTLEGRGESVIQRDGLRLRLIRELEGGDGGLRVTQDRRDVSLEGMFVPGSSPITIKGPSPVFRELPEVQPDLRYFRAALSYPGGEVYTTFH